MTDQDRIARAMLEEMGVLGGVDVFADKLMGFPEKYCSNLAQAAMCEVARIETERLERKT